jgi:hypothetical protein
MASSPSHTVMSMPMFTVEYVTLGPLGPARRRSARQLNGNRIDGSRSCGDVHFTRVK